MSDSDFTVVPVRLCKRCGARDRFENGKCKPCTRANKAKWVLASESSKKLAEAAIAKAEKERRSSEAKAWANSNPGAAESRKATGAKWRSKNKEHLANEKAAWYVANKDACRTASASRYAANPERDKDAAKAWREANLERSKATGLAWRQANPGAKKISESNRRARKINSGGKLTKGLAEKLFTLQKGMCPCCNQPLGDNYHLDHIMPLARGGANTDGNMQLLRQRCNNQKHAKDPLLFMQSRGFLL